MRRAREKSKNDITCYCGIKGHISSKCRNKQKCYNCQGFNHIAADCKQPKEDASRGKGFRENSKSRGKRRGRERNKITLRTADEAVMSVSEGAHLITQQINENNSPTNTEM